MSVPTHQPTLPIKNIDRLIPGSQEQKTKHARRQSLLTVIILSAASVLLLMAGMFSHQWQLHLLAAISATGALANWLGFHSIQPHTLERAVYTTAAAWFIECIAIAALVAEVNVAAACIIILLSIYFPAESLSVQHFNRFVIGGMFSAILAMVFNVFVEIPKLQIPALSRLIPILLVILLVLYIELIIRSFRAYPLQVRLVTIFLAISLIPLVLVASIYNYALTNTALQNAQASLQSAANQTAYALDTFINQNKAEIQWESQNTILISAMQTTPPLRFETDQKQIQNLLNTFQKRDPDYITTVGILDRNGKSILDTTPNYMGRNESTRDYFLDPQKNAGGFVSSVVFFNPKQAEIYFSAPIQSSTGEFLGVLRAAYKANKLQEITQRYSGLLGGQANAILIDANMIRLADSLTPENVGKTIQTIDSSTAKKYQAQYLLPNRPLEQLSTNLPDLAAAIENRKTQPYFNVQILNGRTETGATAELTARPWTLIYVQNQSVFLSPVQTQIRIMSLLIIVLAAIVTWLAIGVAALITRPIRHLTDVSLQVSAGNLNARAEAHSSDEIGILSQSFNSMTTQLLTTVTALEKRVAERTQDLEQAVQRSQHHSDQLQTVSDVARAITQIQDLETLLTSVTQLVSERFGFYHVGIFLLDENKEYAVLRAANSEGGQRMLARNHRLKVGQVGIVGYVTGRGEARIATDVGADAVYFNNPDLPETRSEMALPLTFSDRIIGALDVQSKVANAFSKEDIDLFKILADQIAIAIENNRLFAETRQALEESQQVHRQYLYQEWGREIAERRVRAVQYTHHQGVFVRQPVQRPELQAILASTVPDQQSEKTSESENTTQWVTPIQLRGAVIGAIEFQGREGNRQWTEEEIKMVRSIADQIAVALENARLFEQTVRRAEREQKVLEITSKIRSTTDPQVMLQTAMQELQKALNTSRGQIVMKTPAQHVENLGDGKIPLENSSPDLSTLTEE